MRIRRTPFLTYFLAATTASRDRSHVIVLLVSTIALTVQTSLAVANDPPVATADTATAEPAAAADKDRIELRIVFDNNPSDERLETAWGFSCVITGFEKTILFDTGIDGKMLLRNLEKCGIDPKEIDAVVLSHSHGDHTAGLAEFLKVNAEVEVYMPAIFPAQFKDQVRQTAAKVVETEDPQKACEGVWTTGVIHRRVPEQGIYIRTAEGIVVVTGCAHPGIVQITRAAKAHAKEPVKLVLGGFHLGEIMPDGIERVIDGLKSTGAKQVAPTHCTGEEAIERIRKAFGEEGLAIGAGSRQVFPAAKRQKAAEPDGDDQNAGSAPR
ncbi:MAG: MBL fold metallo-hydrolase [Phycisphaerales bacterium]|nr:MAG: MBL fold metallo-hydrolase [Phycisphaerales bacterium]